MDPSKNTKATDDTYDIDRDGPSSGVNQVNPNPAVKGTDKAGQQGGDPAEVRPQHTQPNRDGQPDGARDPGFIAGEPRVRGGDKPGDK